MAAQIKIQCLVFPSREDNLNLETHLNSDTSIHVAIPKAFKLTKSFVNYDSASHTGSYTKWPPEWYYLQSAWSHLLFHRVLTVFGCEGKSVDHESTPFGIVGFGFVKIPYIGLAVLVPREGSLRLLAIVSQQYCNFVILVDFIFFQGLLLGS